MVQKEPGWLNVSNWLRSAQGAAGRDGLSVPGPPGPPGPPGQIVNLQDVSVDVNCSVKTTAVNSTLLVCCCSCCCSTRRTASSMWPGSLTLRESLWVRRSDSLLLMWLALSPLHFNVEWNWNQCEPCCFLTGSKGWPRSTRTCRTEGRWCFFLSWSWWDSNYVILSPHEGRKPLITVF